MKISRKWVPVILAATLGLLLSLSFSAPAAADDYNCSGSLGSVTVDNLVVLQNATCTLNGTRVTGNIFVLSNATLYAYDVHVNGNIQADGASRVNVNVGSFVGGNIQIKDSSTADIQWVEIDGNLQFEENDRFLQANSNTIGGNLQVFKNSGGVSITYNTIGSNLQCTENFPSPTGMGNIVFGNIEDQCINFDRDAPTIATPVPPSSTAAARTPTPVPPTRTATLQTAFPYIPATATALAATQTAPVANDDRYTFTGGRLSVLAPGILANDTFSAIDLPQVIQVRSPVHGTLSLGQSGDFIYQAQSGYFGEDSFEYLISSAGVESNTAVVHLRMVDPPGPIMEWISPVKGEGEHYNLYEGEQVILEVSATDNNAIGWVTFTRWDAVHLTFVEIARVSEPPFRTEVSASSLNSGWNQVDMVAVDQAGNTSEVSHIWLFKFSQVKMDHPIFLPVARK